MEQPLLKFPAAEIWIPGPKGGGGLSNRWYSCSRAPALLALYTGTAPLALHSWCCTPTHHLSVPALLFPQPCVHKTEAGSASPPPPRRPEGGPPPAVWGRAAHAPWRGDRCRTGAGHFVSGTGTGEHPPRCALTPCGFHRQVCAVRVRPRPAAPPWSHAPVTNRTCPFESF
eukprot:gene22623-biopygen7219